jgi:hypothetical protein
MDIERAVKETLDKIGKTIEPELLEVVLRNHDYFRRVMGHSFHDAMSPALDTSCIWKEEKRELYASAIPRYFQPVAQAARRRNMRIRAKKKKAAKQKAEEPVVTAKNRQAKFDF